MVARGRDDTSDLPRVRSKLRRAASSKQTVNYGQLMKEFRVSRGRPLTRLISEADRGEHTEGAPGFAAIIVRKDTGYPGGGYFCDLSLPLSLRRTRERATDPKLSAAEKKHVTDQQAKIWAYYERP
ncbi:MAG: hypothetical protein HY296_05220 [Thaumarchaeota archaeon]|nr:hypothetical protein [Nitrososphaerota archaeon]